MDANPLRKALKTFVFRRSGKSLCHRVPSQGSASSVPALSPALHCKWQSKSKAARARFNSVVAVSNKINRPLSHPRCLETFRWAR